MRDYKTPRPSTSPPPFTPSRNLSESPNQVFTYPHKSNNFRIFFGGGWFILWTVNVCWESFPGLGVSF